MSRLTRFTLVAFATIAATAGIALAAAPTVKTEPATAVTATTATLNGTVTPPDTGDVTYFFEYGTTAAYGKQTATQPFNGKATKSVDAAVTGLAPSTLYHYRLVATNTTTNEVARGDDVTFTTLAPDPNANAIDIAASNRTITFGRSTTISGTLTGPGKAGVVVTLEEDSAPYTGNFKPTGSVTTTDAAGKYSFVVSPGKNTKYRVSAKTVNRPDAVSGELLVRVRVKVTLGLSDRTPSIGQRVRFAGHVTPGHDGKIAKIQRRKADGGWRTVATTTLVAATPVGTTPRSKYSKRIRITKNGTYRVRVAPADGDHIAGSSRRKSVVVH